MTSRRIAKLAAASLALVAVAIAAPVAANSINRIISTPMGTQPTVNPQVRILTPNPGVPTYSRLQRVPIRVAYQQFDHRPDLRTPNAGATLGSESQVVTEGRVQGHIHAYLQPLNADGSLGSSTPASFCVLDVTESSNGYDGIASGSCPAVPAGWYRLSVDMQSNSHVAVLKNGPQSVPTADSITIKVV
ncbi:MAG: hypothetical protein ACO3AV_09755 [Ilumatobacteraceae bacterium]|jgi:hypothetical protein